MAPPKLPTGNFASLPVGGKVFLLFALLAMISSAYYLSVHMALEEETGGATRAHGVLEQQLREANERQKEYLRLREELAGREALDRQNLRILPKDAEIPAFLDDLNRLAELSGLDMKAVKPAPERAEEFFVRVPIVLEMSGRYHQLAKFFYNISRLERAINMENITLSYTADQKSEEIRLKVGVEATTFRRRDAEGA